MPATLSQIAAAAKALQQEADREISKLPIFEQGMARRGLSDQLLRQFAKVAADAAVDSKET